MNRTQQALWLAILALTGSALAEERPATIAAPTARTQVQGTNAVLLTTQQVERLALAAEPPPRISPEDRATLDRVADLYRQGKQQEATSLWIRMAQPAAGKGKEGGKEWIELESWSYYVLYRAFIQPDPELRARAENVQWARASHEAAHVVQQNTQPSKASARDSQLASTELQSALQQEQRTYTALSNVMKSMHETAKNAIRNMK